MKAFVYERPESLADALAAMGAAGDVRALAGGTDFVLQRAGGDLAPDHVIDLKRVDALTGVTVEDGAVAIGAATTLHALSAVAGMGVDALLDGARIVGSVQTRRRATLGGNICRSSPAGDTLPALLVLDAKLALASAAGERTVRAEDFFTGPGLNVLAPGELLTTVRVSARPGSAYARLTYREWMDLAVIGVAAAVQLDGDAVAAAAVALGGAAPTPVLVPAAGDALAGSLPTEAAIDAAAAAVAAAARPIDDVRGSADYRRTALRPLARRVIEQAVARAKGKLQIATSESER
jgi:CO/xanthine dehydrogenase FAD-binding subunit